MNNFWLDNKKELQNVKDYVLLMLGSPVVKVELDDDQLDAIIETTYSHLKERNMRRFDHFIKNGAYILAMGALGHIRLNQAVHDPILESGGLALIKESGELWLGWLEAITEDHQKQKLDRPFEM